jgi:ABC-type proline/glycine betaine transport system permease subunit
MVCYTIPLLSILGIAMPVFSSGDLLYEHIGYEAPAAIAVHTTITQSPHKRQIPTEQTCGYLSGDRTLSRTAALGWACRFDTANFLWGFCPQTVVAASDCGLAGYCLDNDECTGGCGRLLDMSDITTVTWYGTIP